MEFKSKEFIIQELIKEYGKGRVKVISTKDVDLTTNPKGRNSKKDRSNWADSVVKKYYKIKRSAIVKKGRAHSTGEYNFSYIKLAQKDNGEIVGIVNGKSSFHCMYPSDVWFYDFKDFIMKMEKKGRKEDGLKAWYQEEIILLINENPKNSNEAYDNEKWMKNHFNLID
jgi:hypothetical protein